MASTSTCPPRLRALASLKVPTKMVEQDGDLLSPTGVLMIPELPPLSPMCASVDLPADPSIDARLGVGQCRKLGGRQAKGAGMDGLHLSRATVPLSWVGEVPPTTILSASTPRPSQVGKGWVVESLCRPMPLVWGVGAWVDGEIDALEGAGYWDTPPSLSALVRAASADTSGDAALCF